MRKNKLLLLLVLLTMLSTRAVAQDDASAMREQMKERIDELKALAPDNVKGLNQTLRNDVNVYIAWYTEWYNASPLKSYDDYEEAYDNLGGIIDRVNKYLAAYGEFTDNMAKLKDLIDNFNAGTEENKQGYKKFAQDVYNAYKALSEHDMIALDDEDLEAQKEYDDNEYGYVPEDVTSDNIAYVVGDPSGYISTYGQFNAFFSQNTKELGSIYLKVEGTGTAVSPENLTAQLRNPNLENADEQWWGTEWTSIGNSAAEQSGKPFITYQPVHLPSGYYTLVGYGMDRRGSWADVLANDEDWNEDHRTYLFSHLDIDGSDSTMVDAFKAKNMALTADITNGAGNISTCEVDGVTYYTPNSMAQYRAWEDAKRAMAGQGHGAVVQFWVWQDEGDFGTLGFAHRWHADNTWFVADGIQLYYATDNYPKINIDTPDCASVTITDDGWATFYTDKALAFSGIKGLTAYTAKRDGSTVTLTPVDNVPANTGVVLKGDAKTYNIPIIASSTTDKGELQGSATTATAFDAHATVGGIYVLGLNDTNEAQFEKKTSGNVPAGQPYLLVPTAEEPSSPLLVVIAGEPTEPTYTVEFAEGTEESDKWTAEPNTGVKKGQTVTVTYTGSKKVIGVKAEKRPEFVPGATIQNIESFVEVENNRDGTITLHMPTLKPSTYNVTNSSISNGEHTLHYGYEIGSGTDMSYIGADIITKSWSDHTPFSERDKTIDITSGKPRVAILIPGHVQSATCPAPGREHYWGLYRYTNPVKVTYNLGGGSVSGSTADKVEYLFSGDALATTFAAPTREGYTFDGWYTSAEGGTKLTASNATSATTIYAHWNAIAD